MRIVLAEDSLLLREGVAQLLALEGHEIVDGTSNATELLRAVAQHAPALAIIDVRMPPDFVDEGVHVALRIRRDHPGTAVLLLSQVIERRYARELLDGSVGVATCSRTGSPTSVASSTPSRRSPPAAPPSTPR